MGKDNTTRKTEESYIQLACEMGGGRCEESDLLKVVGSALLDDLESRGEISREGGFVYSWEALSYVAYQRDLKREVAR